ncbi:MAG: NAD-dependent epimerase/dehydratase family protein [Spirochaetota bacterium]|nr:MAG: NAD-dependent epimerase/dehydratase family protein [Spirochaetota bacterium]
MSKNILILGASGFIGTSVVQELTGREYTIHCFVRETSDLTYLKRINSKLEYHFGDILNRETLIAPMKKCSIIINCTGLNSFWERKNKRYNDINIQGTGNIMEIALAMKVEKIVHISTVMAYGFPDKMPFNENSEPGPHMSHYAKTKYLGDLYALKLYKEKQLPLVCVYLAAVLGRGDSKDVMKIGMFLSNKVKIMLRSENRFTYVYNKDAAQAIVKAAEKANNIGEKYLIGNQRLTTREYMELIGDLSGIPVPKKTIGKKATMFLAYINSLASKISKKPPLLPVDLMKTQFRGSLLFDASKSEKELGMKYTPIKVALKDEIDFIRENIGK